MENIISIIKELQGTTKRTEKESILNNNKDNQLLRDIFQFVYNPYIVTGFSTKKLTKKVKPLEQSIITDIYELMDYLKNNNTGKDSDIQVVQTYCSTLSDEEKEVVKEIITKSLKVGCTAKTFNKIYGEDFLPEFGVMLAESYFKQKEDFLEGKEFIITTKLDGNRLVIIKDEEGKVKFFTRQGQSVEGLVDIEKDMESFPNNLVLDGEVIAENPENLPSDELFRKTMKIVRKDGEKHGLLFNCFDCVDLKDFKKGLSQQLCAERKARISKLIEMANPQHIIEVKVLYQGKDSNEIMKWLDWAKDNQMEGVMVNIANAPYECKRTKGILKVKSMQDADLRVVGFEKGEGNFRDTLGRINVEFKDNVVGVGSGFELAMRNEIWNNQENYINKIATIQYFEVTKNQKDDKESLRFPVFKGWRFDKDEPSYN